MHDKAIAAVVGAMSEERGRSVADIAKRADLLPSVTVAIMRGLYLNGDIQADEESGGWMLT